MMSNRRITIYDYPEHLNPFHEDIKIERKPDVSKYGTWGSTSRSKIRKSIIDSTWIEALNLSPAKKTVSKKWSFIKTHTVEKLRVRSKSNPPEYNVQRPEQREVINIRPQRLFTERLVVTSTPIKDDLNAQIPEKVPRRPKEETYENQGAIPKTRKKRAAPRPPSSVFNPDSETIWNTSDSCCENQQSLDYEEIQVMQQLPEPISNDERQNEISENVHIKPLIGEPNIATLVSNNLTM